MIRIEMAVFILFTLAAGLASAAAKPDADRCLDRDPKACARVCKALGDDWGALDDRCENGDGALCRQLGVVWEHGPCLGPNAFIASERFRHGCEAKDRESCAEYARLSALGLGNAEVAEQKKRVQEYLPDACEAGSERACTTLGLLHAEGRLVTRDDAEALRLFRQGCPKSQRACAGIALLMAEGRGGLETTPESAFLMANVACEDGEPFGCEVLARFELAGTGTVKDPAKAEELFRKACDVQEGSACASLAKLLLERGGAKAEAAAAKVADKACEQTEEPESCDLSGMLKARHKAWSEANDAWWTACRSGRASACIAGGRLLLAGRGQGLNHATAWAYGKAGCDAGDAESCAILAQCVETGEPYPPKDPAKAAGLYAQACAGGFAKACDDARRLGAAPTGEFVAGKPLEIDPAAQAAAKKPKGDLETRCLDGNLHACRGLRDVIGGDDGQRRLLAACTSGKAEACRMFGVLVENLGADAKSAMQAFQGACQLGDRDGCVHAARLLLASDLRMNNGEVIVQGLEKKCDEGSARGCLHAGLAYEAGDGVGADARRAATLFRKACDGGALPGCAMLANLYFQGKGVEKDVKKAEALLVRSCDDGLPYGCAQLGMRAEEGEGLPKDAARAAAAYARGCAFDDATSCGALGELEEAGEGVAKDPRGALDLLRKGCEGGDESYCAHAGELVAKSDPKAAAKLWKLGCDAKDPDSCAALAKAPGAPDPFSKPKGASSDEALAQDEKLCDAGMFAACKRLFQAYEKDHAVPLEAACKAGELAKCRRLAMLLQSGIAVKQDLARAATLFAKACDGGDEPACEKVVRAYAGGHGVERDDARAAAIAKRGCDAGQQGSCELLASFRLEGRGVAKDAAEASRLAKKACESEARRACDIAGRSLLEGNGVAKDLEAGRKLLQRGCEGHDGRACNSLGVLYGEGIGVEKNDVGAANAFRDGCDAGQASSCRWLGFLYENGRAYSEHRGSDASLRYAEACDDGDANGCLRLGALLRAGKLVDADPETAAEVFEKACQGGEAAGCTALGDAYAAGKGVKQDAAAAKKWFGYGCSGGDQAACGRMKGP